MSNSLVLTLASSHSGALASLISQLPSLNYENVVGNLVAVILSVSCLSVVSTLRIVQIGLVVSTWLDFHLKLFPSMFSFSNCNLVDCGFDLVCILLHFLICRWSCKGLFSVGCINSLICFAISTKFSFCGIKLKSLMRFSLSSCHKKVSPLAYSILYHLFGKSARVDGNKCGHARSSLYPSLLHSLS